ncbi:MAG: pyrroline-5-carboxylate reductase [Pseudomonadota bacterium]|jgi:pyrroline-5-carboxylate reductase
MTHPFSLSPDTRIAFVGGGNMASAVIGGLCRQGLSAGRIDVIEPFEATREALRVTHGIVAHAKPDAFLCGVDLIVWAIKPQDFAQAALSVRPYTEHALQLSVMAGIRTQAIACAMGSARVVRCMPNTPALVGQGIAGLFAVSAVTPSDRYLAETVIATTGTHLWVDREDLLDAVTALSGSGPAYVFYFLEAMQQAGTELGLSPEQGRQLAVSTFLGSSVLARDSLEQLGTLRERVTSKGGTTHAALTWLEHTGVKGSFVEAIHAACSRAKELGSEHIR